MFALWVDTPRPDTPGGGGGGVGQTATAVDGTYHTGMHSCSHNKIKSENMATKTPTYRIDLKMERIITCSVKCFLEFTVDVSCCI